MYFQLLGAPMPQSPPHYRGVYRCGPMYLDALAASAPANRAWQRYVSDLGEKVPTEEVALTLADALAEVGESFDVVGLDDCTEVPPAPDAKQTLGFDITMRGWHSLLSWGLHWDTDSLRQLPLGPLLALLEAHFRPRLNEFGLFGDWLDARHFFDVAQTLAVLSPGVWEAPGHEQLEIMRVIAVRVTPWSPLHNGVAVLQTAKV